MEALEQLSVFKNIFGTSDAFIYRCHNDKDYTMQFMTGQVDRITGYQIDSLLGNRDASFVSITHPDDVDRVFGVVDAAIEKREPWNLRYRLIRQDGSVSHIREHGSAIYDAAGELTHLQGLIADATPEVELIERTEANLAEEQASNANVLKVAGQLADSLRTLSFVAVNARIEAARVGTAGQGFAVIASDTAELLKSNTEIVGRLEDLIRAREAA